MEWVSVGRAGVPAAIDCVPRANHTGLARVVDLDSRVLEGGADAVGGGIIAIHLRLSALPEQRHQLLVGYAQSHRARHRARSYRSGRGITSIICGTRSRRGHTCGGRFACGSGACGSGARGSGARSGRSACSSGSGDRSARSDWSGGGCAIAARSRFWRGRRGAAIHLRHACCHILVALRALVLGPLRRHRLLRLLLVVTLHGTCTERRWVLTGALLLTCPLLSPLSDSEAEWQPARGWCWRARLSRAMVYHSSLNDKDAQAVCGCAMLPLKTTTRGPAPLAPEGKSRAIA